ncbi:SIR2 family NAD-dependent protein deacylase [Brevibacillus laterosporus]|uniref:SIR2 family NAD-dependent protein deacylase n=1 Tax=Brevibacillus laterosporus TaxID=1465 RepID=UPI0018CC9AFD|nr:SIR2 family protein [Brevibacillus laterosporus]MBG9790510.1 hypothetical protein [Brevibacillus laterosporus]
MTKDVEKFFQENLLMYPHLKGIRDKLWMEDGKSRVSVMIGAGFSLNAKKIEASFSGMALWNDLKNRLLKNLSHHQNIQYKDVLEIGQIYVEEYGRSSLDEILKESIPDDNYEPDKLHYALLNLPWTDIYTTNYDTLLERAKRNVYERNYQVIYDINDIPSSVQPRIVKLHGSFPANRPFVFTKKDYDEYPERFSPFVNMVQQSIMETTFVLLGFSGDDPNFDRWTTWVLNNLGEQMPKIYMIGYGQKHRQVDLKAKGITLIDFKDLYENHDDPYSEMFYDLFEFLSYKKRKEKTKWPHQAYPTLNINDLKYNRQTYPGWIVMPDEIRRANAKKIRFSGNSFIEGIASLEDFNMLDHLNEILWCYEKFYIPLDYHVHKKLKQLFSELKNKTDNKLIPLLLHLLQEARLDCNKEEFFEYLSILETTILNHEQKHSYIHEQLLFHLSFNNIEIIERMLLEWNVGAKDVEWGIKKAVILSKINSREKAKDMFETYLQTIRSLLAVQMDDYRLLSLESVALHNRKRITKELDYGYDRLRLLSNKYCDSNKEFDRAVLSVKKYEYTLGTRELPGFDPGTETITSSMGDFMKQELLDSYAILQMQESFGLSIKDLSQYKLALKNLEIIYPLYSQIKRIHYVKIDEMFSREFVYKLDDYNLGILVEMLEKTILGDSKSNIDINAALEIISRIYFALSPEIKMDLDLKIIEFINQMKEFDLRKTRILENLIKRIVFDKNNKETKIFCEQLIETDIKSQLKNNETTYKTEFFEPLLVVFDKRRQISNLNVSEKKLFNMLNDLNNTDDYSIRESALIRLTFLAESKGLSEEYHAKFISSLKHLSKDRSHGFSDFLFSSVFDKIIHSNVVASTSEQKIFLKKDIPALNKANSTYFNELAGIFPDYISMKRMPQREMYKKWLEKFYIWWDSYKEELLRDVNEKVLFLPKPDYLSDVVTALRNNIWGGIPSEFLDKTDRMKASQLFHEIDKRRPDLSIYLIPSLTRLNIEVGYSLEDIIKYPLSKDINKVQAAANVLYDYLIFIDKGEILEDGKRIKKELFNMMYYGSTDIFMAAVGSLSYTIKYAPSVIDEMDCMAISEFADSYLHSIKTQKVEITSINDFETLSSFVRLIGYLYKNKCNSVKCGLNEWKEYIQKHRLPEVRKYTDLFISEV